MYSLPFHLFSFINFFTFTSPFFKNVYCWPLVVTSFLSYFNQHFSFFHCTDFSCPFPFS
jgi:hypothetical protein